MLVLSRKNGECIVIDGGIKVQVIGVGGNRVRLGIDAPKELLILRNELYKIPETGRTFAAVKEK
jgi:carbon storage regulator